MKAILPRESVASELNRQIALTGNFEGERALNVRVVDGYTAANVTVPTDANRYLVMENEFGKSIEITGNASFFFGSQLNTITGSDKILSSLGSNTYSNNTAGNIDGGVDTTADNGVVEVRIDDSSGNSVTRQVQLAALDSSRSFSDFAADLQAAINSAFSGDGYSVTAGVTDGNFSFVM